MQSDIKHFAFDVVRGACCIRAEHGGESKKFHPEQISAMILEYMVGIASDYLGEQVDVFYCSSIL